MYYRWDVQDVFLEAIEAAGFKVRSQVVWDKMVIGMGDLKAGYGPTHELAIFATKGDGFRFPGKRPESVYRVQRVPTCHITHPNEKPRGLAGRILNDLVAPGSNVSIPFCGSGSEVEAAWDRKHNIVTAEIHPKYYRMARSRLSAYISQGTLF